MSQVSQKQPKNQKNDLVIQYNGLFDEIVNNHPDLICEWFPDSTLIFANQAYCQYFGKSLEDLVRNKNGLTW